MNTQHLFIKPNIQSFMFFVTLRKGVGLYLINKEEHTNIVFEQGRAINLDDELKSLLLSLDLNLSDLEYLIREASKIFPPETSRGQYVFARDGKITHRIRVDNGKWNTTVIQGKTE